MEENIKEVIKDFLQRKETLFTLKVLLMFSKVFLVWFKECNIELIET